VILRIKVANRALESSLNLIVTIVHKKNLIQAIQHHKKFIWLEILLWQHPTKHWFPAKHLPINQQPTT